MCLCTKQVPKQDASKQIIEEKQTPKEDNKAPKESKSSKKENDSKKVKQ